MTQRENIVVHLCSGFPTAEYYIWEKIVFFYIRGNKHNSCTVQTADVNNTDQLIYCREFYCWVTVFLALNLEWLDTNDLKNF